MYFNEFFKTCGHLLTAHSVFTLRNLEELKDLIKSGSEFDLIFFTHYSQYIPQEIFSNFKCIGFHTGNLPQDRGGSPIQNKILMKEYNTKLSAFRIVDEMDAGEIYLQSNLDLSEGSLDEIIFGIANLSAKMITNIVLNEPKGVPQKGTPQYFKRLSGKQNSIPEHTSQLRDVFDRIRMLDGLDYPSAYISWGNLKIEFRKARFIQGELIAESKFILETE